MNVNTYLKQVAHKTKWDHGIEGEPLSDIWASNFDDSYIIHVGIEKKVKFLADREITGELTHGVGFSPKNNKWYGWSHRAIYGFTIGSTCKKGDCHYSAKDKDDFLENMIDFWKDDCHAVTGGFHSKQEIMHSVPVNPGDPEQKDVPSGEFEEGVTIDWLYNDSTPNKKLRGTKGSSFQCYPDKYGHGEWTAKTMADAKQMAIDFNEGVS